MRTGVRGAKGKVEEFLRALTRGTVRFSLTPFQ
jgi:hypothetical protein